MVVIDVFALSWARGISCLLRWFLFGVFCILRGVKVVNLRFYLQLMEGDYITTMFVLLYYGHRRIFIA